MKLRLLLVIALFTFLSSSATNIDVTTALNVAKSFYSQKAAVNSVVNKESATLSLAYQYTNATSNPSGRSEGENLYYVFNINSSDGFIIISGDDLAIPVLGYTTRGSYDSNHLPETFRAWMDSYKQQILFAKANFAAANNNVKASWDELLNAQHTVVSERVASSTVSPLISTTWDQEPYYNDLCPYDANNTYNYHAVTGCVATAMAQIMKYWSYPAQGAGYHSYYSSTYGTLSANFANTTYNWSNMPAYLTSSNTDVATLMYQCGVSVEMDYGPDASGAYVISSDNPVCSQSAYVDYFGYDGTSIQGLSRDNYSNFTTWKNLLKTELNNQRPVQYAGFGSSGGHTWVCDGYDANDYFHMNWGWSGQGPDGYYSLDALDPPVLGADGGTGGFDYGQQALIGIKPMANPVLGNISLDSYITVSPNPIPFDSLFTLNVDLINTGSTAFTGSYIAQLFNSSGTLVSTLQTISTNGTPLPVGYHYPGGLVFQCTDGTLPPGNYTIGIYYSPSSGGTYLASPDGYINPIHVTITGPSGDLELTTPMTPSPTTFIVGQAAYVTLNLLNSTSTTYTGVYEVDLFDMNGYYVETIGDYNETSGLAAGHSYGSLLTFSTSDITAAPAQYILAAFETQDEGNTWNLVGGEQYANPVLINVSDAGLLPDIYELNNTQQSAYPLALSWTNNASESKTTGSTIHSETDIDYYKIILAPGYNYTITARTDDSNNSNDGSSYTCDVLWTYNSGAGWSATHENTMSGAITTTGPGTVFFEVTPYFQGSTGTYLLDLHVNRVAVTGLNEMSTSIMPLEVYPNPAHNFVQVKAPEGEHVVSYTIINSLGQVMLNVPAVSSASVQTINTFSLAAGIYNLEATTEKEKYGSRFIISR